MAWADTSQDSQVLAGGRAGAALWGAGCPGCTLRSTVCLTQKLEARAVVRALGGLGAPCRAPLQQRADADGCEWGALSKEKGATGTESASQTAGQGPLHLRLLGGDRMPEGRGAQSPSPVRGL